MHTLLMLRLSQLEPVPTEGARSSCVLDRQTNENEMTHVPVDMCAKQMNA